MLDKDTQKKILDYIYLKPRTVQEVAELIGKNWRTADTFVNKIAKETGLISGRTFREGTRGALKIIFWNTTENISSNQFQDRLRKQIESAKSQTDFSPLDIYQYVSEEKKRAFSEIVTDETVSKVQDIVGLFAKAKRQILYFSGNMSFLDLREKKKSILDIIEDAAARGISIKVLARIDIASIENFQKMMQVNYKLGKEMIEIRHAVQPLRGFIIDDCEVRLKEEKNPNNYKKGELKHKTRLFYEIYDPDWICWLQKVFWNYFRTSLDAKIRMKDLEMIRKL
jgi:hypothetical protein